MNVAAWLYKGEWHLFTSELNRVVSDQAHYQANLKEEEKRDLVLLRLTTKDSNTLYWFHFNINNYFGKHTPAIYTQELPKELEALLTIYGL
ncbi:hypothetical protein [Pseudomonas phage RWG]|uniref:Uncharacterized protein n=2 Tax=Litunavirus Ab09 TaxID=1920765 RepID=A0A191ZBH5_9CAUD|nr:hypothetical protein BI066_gp22 [Pseudomonas phage PEV2]AIZ94772.1 hypothetical protein [Pseudomonas phage RWG]ANJ63722.1 hypothetical protein [Pseudomonas phage PEV2]UYE96528.1 hypothetical protein [Pseudomonas phage vB_PaeP_4032]UYE96614.1 hypothetical protein [Pseudomonas phage vB_PaeP_4034]